MRAGAVAVIAALSLAAVSDARAQANEAELKVRFRERISAVRALKDAGKIGETIEGLLAPVGERGDGSVEQVISAENGDRMALYAIIAKRTNEPLAEVAKQAAIRNYRDASPDHYLRLRDGSWIQKKQIRSQPTG